MPRRRGDRGAAAHALQARDRELVLGVADPLLELPAVGARLAAVVWASVRLEERFALVRSLSSALVAILAAMVLSNVGLIPGNSPAYDFLFGPGVMAGIALIMLCILTLAYDPRRGSATRRAAVLLSLAGFFVWGIWGFLVKASVDALGEGSLDLLLAAGYLGVTAAYAALRRKANGPADPPTRRTWLLGGFVFLAGGGSAVALTIAYDLGPAAAVAPISGTYPIIATLAAAAILKEKLDWRIAVALIAFGLGIVLLSGA